MKRKRIIPFLLFPAFIAIILMLRDGTLLEWDIDFNIIHNICGISALSHFGLVSQILTDSLAFRFGMIMILLTILYGPFFCGYICPFGTYQRIVRLIGNYLGLNVNLPKILHKILSLLKYVILVGFVYWIVTDTIMFYINLDPYHGFIRIFYGGLSLIGALYLILVTLSGLFIDRPFCNYLCPYGAGFNLLGFFRVFKVTRHDSCIHCKRCDKVCPVEITISTKDRVSNLNCLKCNACVESCPKDGALTIEHHYRNYIAFFLAVALVVTVIVLLPYREPLVESVLSSDEDEILIEIKDDFNTVIQEEKTVFQYKDPDISFIKETLQSDLDELTALKEAEALRLYLEEQARLEEERLAKAAAEAAAKAAAEAKAKAEAEAKAAAEAAAKAAAEAEAASKYIYNDGIYKATVNAYRPNMVVQIEIKEDVILSIDILEHHETKSYFNYSAPKMINAILAANSTNVDAISRATFTSLGIRNGVKACLNKAKK